jgi:tetratricopeptide (TPR) repeat protein
MDEAVALFERASELDPNEYQSSCLMVNIYIASKADPAKIESVSKRALERATRHLEQCPDDTRAVYLSVAPLVALGRAEEATKRVEQSMLMDPDAADAHYNAACYFALEGNSERALDCLERAIDCGFNTREWIEHDTDIDSLRQIDRYKAIMKRLK